MTQVENNKESDETLIAKAQNGDSAAFNQLIERHYMTIYKIAYKWCGIKEDAEDIAQDVCIKLGRVIQGFNHDASFTTWLYRITVNQVKDMQKSAYRKYQSAEEMDENAFPTASTQESTILGHQLQRVINRLPEKQKDAVILVLVEGMSHQEAATILECAETTISWRVFTARKQLTKILKQGGSYE